MKTTFLGHELQSPIIVGSSPASFGADAMIRCHEAGAGAVVCKTINRNAAENPDLHMVVAGRETLMNCEKWTDFPMERWLDDEMPRAVAAGVKCIASVGHGIEDSRLCVERLEEIGVMAIELVSYTDDTVLPMLEDTKRRVDIPVIVKLSPNSADLMGHGIKVDGGETLGKSIVFAYDHRHAQMIVDRFHALWPALPADYCQLVDNTVSRADDLVLDFGQKSGFRIAVSVDMLDTGIDVPEVLNLVFFKPVRSKIKFVQMIGRGTRLCPGVFGPVLPDKSTDKKSFRIFDYCGNFEYFSEGGETEEPESRLGTTGIIRCVQFELLSELQKIEHQSVPGRKAWHGALRSFLRGEVAAVRSRSFRIAVRAEMELLDRFAPERTWEYLAPTDVRKLQHRIVPLMDGDPADPPLSKIFDLRMLRIALARLSGGAWPGPAKKDVEAVMRCATALLKKGSIPQVAAAAADLRHLASAEWWRAPDALDIEDLRKKLRDAMQFLGGEGREAIVVDQEDEVRDGGDPGGDLVDIRSYRQKAVDWLADHGDDPAVVKIRNLEKLDPEDWARLEDVLWRKIGGEEDYHAEIGDKPLAAFVRSIVGIDQDAINAKYGEFLTGNVLNPMQQDFVRTIIEYVRQTGDITPDDIIDKPPFCDYDSVELFQERLPDVRSMVEFLHGLIAA